METSSRVIMEMYNMEALEILKCQQNGVPLEAAYVGQ